MPSQSVRVNEKQNEIERGAPPPKLIVVLKRSQAVERCTTALRQVDRLWLHGGWDYYASFRDS